MKIADVAGSGNGFLEPSPLVREKTAGSKTITRIVTTSWDDGARCDLQVAELLAARRLPGTFYIPVQSHRRAPRMSLEELVKLDSQGFEIGAHGVSHMNLPDCSPVQLVNEVETCKKRLEDDLGKQVTMFAYPQGRHNRHTIAALKQAGYSGGRTTAMMARYLRFNPYRMPTSAHVYPHSRFEYFRNLARVWDVRRTWLYATHLRWTDNWVEFAKLIFDEVMVNGGIWHLYGHSWEIEEMRLWTGLKEVLDYVCHRPGVLYIPNRTIVSLQAEHWAGAACPAGAVLDDSRASQRVPAHERPLGV